MSGEFDPALRTKLCLLLGIDIPIVQPGMGWVADGEPAAATAEAGSFGMIGAAPMGADAVIVQGGEVMGPRMLMTVESQIPASVKAVYLKKDVADAGVTNQIDGHPHRALRTAFVDRLVSSSGWRGLGRADQRHQAKVEFGIISGGQVTGLINDIPTATDLVQHVMLEATAVLNGFCA